jgi:hypothetical protein
MVPDQSVAHYVQSVNVEMHKAGVCAMDESFVERVQRWKHKTKGDLQRHWWGLVLLFLAGMVEHRFFESANRFIDDHVHLADLKPLLQVLASTALIRPIILALGLFLVGLFVILVHAYWATRNADDPNRPRLALWAPSSDGTTSFWRQYAYVFKLKNVGERTARAIRFDPIYSQPGNYELRFDEVNVLVKNEDIPLGISVSFDDYTIGEMSEKQERNDPHALRQFLNQDLPNDRTMKFKLVARFYDTNDRALEEHMEMECRMPGMYIKFRPVVPEKGRK